MPEKKQNYYLLYFVYSTNFVTLGANATGSDTLQIISDSDFQCNYMTAHVRQANVIVTNWGGTVQITDSSKGRDLFNREIALDAIRGDGSLPYPLNPPRIFRKNTSAVIRFSNNVATATEVQLCLHGYKMMPANFAS